MNNFEEVLKKALAALAKYPDSVEELATQLHNITAACEVEAKKYDISYVYGTHKTEAV